MCLLLGRGDQGVYLCVCPLQGRGKDGVLGGPGPHSSQGNDVGRNRLSDLQTAVCSEFLLIPGQRERLEPAGEGLLRGDPGEVWWGACRDRLEAAGPGLSLQELGPESHPRLCPHFLASHAHCRSSTNSYTARPQKGA